VLKTAVLGRIHRRPMNFMPGSRLSFQMTSPHPSSIAFRAGDVAADGLAIEALARLQLAARRFGVEIRLRQASSELLDLIAFAGLADVLRVEVEGEAEEREERGGAKEEGELDDLTF
jgi:hypothetical protein